MYIDTVDSINTTSVATVDSAVESTFDRQSI
jgi:hypothetical protein